MLNHRKSSSVVTLAIAYAFWLVGCSDETFMPQIPGLPQNGSPMEFRGSISQQNLSRADESGFADGDRMGIFVVDYIDNQPGQLLPAGNRADNLMLTLNADGGLWHAATDIYWRDETTPVDVYGYYPYANGLSEIGTFPFEVSATQNILGSDGDMGHYESSDFLWAKATRAVPGQRIELSYTHRMAGVRVILQAGEGFSDTEWAKLSRQVSVNNTLRSATIDLRTGIVTPTGSFDRNIVMAAESDAYRAIVVPQSVDAGKSVIGITLDGITYNYVRDGGMDYKAGKLHSFTIKVDKRAASGDYSITLIDETITPWIADELSHAFEANSYVVVHVPEEGTLKACLSAAGIDKSTIRNLKITGRLTTSDFRLLRDEMPLLTALNIGEVKLVNCAYECHYILVNDNPVEIIEESKDNGLPVNAFSNKISLRLLILPNCITWLGDNSLYGLNLSSTLTLPESIYEINSGALSSIKENCTIVLPNSLKIIKSKAFNNCEAHIQLNLPNTLEYIGNEAFTNTPNLTGNFVLPPNLKTLGEYAFDHCGKDLTGEIIIPNGLTVIEPCVFANMNFKNGTTLIIPDGITSIGEMAFEKLTFMNPVHIPNSVKRINAYAFRYTKFNNSISIPSNINFLGVGAFYRSNIKGRIDYPSNLDFVIGGDDFYFHGGAFSSTDIDSLILHDNIQSIHVSAFEDCQNLRYVEIGKNINYIGEKSFKQCGRIETMICYAKDPPMAFDESFTGMYFDKTVLEVPAGCVETYRRAQGWNQFKNITVHRELAFNLPEINCLNKSTKQTGIIRAESAWQVTECPSWVNLSANSGTGKDEITVTVDALPAGSGNREGKIVFSLTGKNYSTYTRVRQYDSQYGEDSEIILQTASAAGMPLNLFIIGDGFGAESIIDGTYMATMRQQMEYFFAIEPYKTLRDHFNVLTAVACSPDDGTGDAITIRRSRLGTNGVTPDTEQIKNYIRNVSPGLSGDILIIIVSNYNSFNGVTKTDGKYSIAVIGRTDSSYPYDQRGLVQHYAGGIAFAGLGAESVSHFDFIKGCHCPGCNAMSIFASQKSKGLFENISISGKMYEVPWSPFLFHEKYSYIVDVYEGGYNHARGVWRSEPQSVMSTFIPYYNTISRYAIYKEIMRRAGLKASLDDFIANDKIELPQ